MAMLGEVAVACHAVCCWDTAWNEARTHLVRKDANQAGVHRSNA